MIRIVTLSLALCALAACSTDPQQMARAAGCEAGYADAGRDGTIIGGGPRGGGGGDPQWRVGWDEGYRACYEEERRNPRMLPPY